MTETFRNEKELVNYLIHLLNSKGNFVWRNNAGLIHLRYQNKKGQTKERRLLVGIKGGSDILGVAWDGKFIAIECKHGKYKTTFLQEEFLKEVRARGGYAIVARSEADLPEMLLNPPNLERW